MSGAVSTFKTQPWRVMLCRRIEARVGLDDASATRKSSSKQTCQVGKDVALRKTYHHPYRAVAVVEREWPARMHAFVMKAE
jgi:hypothetical protein